MDAQQLQQLQQMAMQQQGQMQQPQMEDAGRGTDNTIAHLSLGEVIIPRAFLDDPDFIQMLTLFFQQNNTDINEFTVGHQANKINPETGYPEFFKFKNIFREAGKVVAPLTDNKVVDGIKQVAQSPIGQIGIPIALNFLAPGVGSAIGSSILGAGAAGSATLGSSLIGAGVGAAGGGLKGALTGGISGGLAPNLGDISSTLGSYVGGGGNSAKLGSTGNLPWLSSGSNTGGLASSIFGSGKSGGNPLSGAFYGFAPSLANLAGGIGDDRALEKARNQLLEGNRQQLANLETFDPSGITQDPGYQFRLEQGQKALDKSAAARGNFFSGRALQAATQYNQDYANNSFNDYYQRWLQKVGNQNNLYANNAATNAQTTIGRGNNFNQTLVNTVSPNNPNDLLKRLLGVA